MQSYVVSHERRPQTVKLTLEKERTPEELEKAQEDIGYVILQTCGAHRIFYETIDCVRREIAGDDPFTVAGRCESPPAM